MLSSNHWHRYAGHWDKVATPLTPHASDVQIYAQELDTQVATLLLGVTPQIAALDLRGVAVDRNLAMIRANPPAPERWRAMQADWLALPLETGAVAQIVGDGVLTMLQYGQDYPRLMQGLHRVLQPGGKCVLRLFVAPEVREPVDDIVAAVWAGEVGSFHALKWRLMMSLCSVENAYNVRVADMLSLFDKNFGDRAALSSLTGWSSAVFDTVDVYRDSGLSLSFPPRAALDALFTQFASHVSYRRGDYELAERCPIVVLENFYP